MSVGYLAKANERIAALEDENLRLLKTLKSACNWIDLIVDDTSDETALLEAESWVSEVRRDLAALKDDGTEAGND